MAGRGKFGATGSRQANDAAGENRVRREDEAGRWDWEGGWQGQRGEEELGDGGG